MVEASILRSNLKAPLNDLDAVTAVSAMRSGELCAEDYARALLDRARELEHLNAFRTLERETVLEAARAADKARASGTALGALHGLPIPVKDSVNTRDLPTSNGTCALEHFRPKDDAQVLKALFAQGAILMGKTNIHEMSRGWTCNNGAFGAVRNPWDPNRIPGGSSGGSAAAVASRMAPLAIAEDTLGSIRVPASLCGIAGLRPTVGRYPNAGIMPLTLGKLDQVGPLARSVADLVLFDAVVTGDFTPLGARSFQGVRIGISEFLLSALDPEVERIVNAALAKLEAAGAILVRAELPEIAKLAHPIANALIGYENPASIAAFLADEGAGVSFEEVLARASPNIQERYRTPIAREAYEEALQRREQLTQAMRDYFKANAIEVIAFPPVLAPALPLGDNTEVEIRGEKVTLGRVMARNLAVGSVAGLPGLVLPAGFTANGLPVGLELDAPQGRDRMLLSLGVALEPVIVAA